MTRPDFVLARIDSARVGLAIQSEENAKQELIKLSEEKHIFGRT